jgi:AcrR family transcriptional regulator
VSDNGPARVDQADGSRKPLDRRAVLNAATKLIERDGLSELTMRRVGAELNVQAMALYRYVPSRENLIDGVVELVVDELYADPDVLLHPADGWQDYLERLAHGLRRVALGHPQLFPLIATRPPAAPWVRPPLRSLRWIEAFLGGLAAEGFSDQSAIYTYRAFTSFLLGHLMLEVAALGVNVSPVDNDQLAEPPGDPLAGYPLLSRLQTDLGQNESAAEFDESLAGLLDRLADRVASTTPLPLKGTS